MFPTPFLSTPYSDFDTSQGQSRQSQFSFNTLTLPDPSTDPLLIVMPPATPKPTPEIDMASMYRDLERGTSTIEDFQRSNFGERMEQHVQHVQHVQHATKIDIWSPLPETTAEELESAEERKLRKEKLCREVISPSWSKSSKDIYTSPLSFDTLSSTRAFNYVSCNC
ncbi:uncharacterized protein NECHADRAFT_83080 [Fusarium vanettenii 77-13-4]|uniref:Uncharacterized protein n=1 Tax=Fusarium vanettenii (strain ATCC MYA-4622 / CBS 123669 / FGSC 9596 / NRRL 45880 / 77-13-4) TaxID=660122 RepID=C7ZBA6_FUSV7|nr:uncharacterized protein NECHADRAFT_83080 [Fusarium vanettenii 77-13-4]EEU38812.1 predicted protein [Fusarium vanettenii 77-13-4]